MAIVEKYKNGKVKSFTISRRRHLRGQDDGFLRDEKGSMCCLGHFARACGVEAKELVGLGMPSDLTDKGTAVSDQYTELLLYKPSWSKDFIDNGLAAELAGINDNTEITNAEREAKLIEKFAKMKPPIKLTFTG